MTRMVEENRMHIGTLKTLGYSGLQISAKFIIYASLASIIGGILGMLIGFSLLPKIIWMMYSMMYFIPNFVIEFNWLYASIGLISIYICIIGATILSIRKEIKQLPAVLMRPKAPTVGKRVLIEKIGFIWNRLNFIQKVTVRNMFRYKKRLLLTVIGIFGCTSLIVTGFGIKDSIARILSDQYGSVFRYDLQVHLKKDLNESQINDVLKNILDKDIVNDAIIAYESSITVINNKNAEDAQIIVPSKNEEINKVINLNEVNTDEKLLIDDETVILTDKLAELLKVNKGDIILLKNSDGIEVQVTVGAIAENYINHYVYMSKQMYNNLFGTYIDNSIYLNYKQTSDEINNEISKEIIELENVTGVAQTSYIRGLMNDMMSSLNYVVIILIFSSGLLAFVVLFNLANINISERIRELATIKVLGFYDKEVFDYLNRETIILTIIGTILGLFGGYFLTYYILGTCEINVLRFAKTVSIQSYIYSTLITISFTLIVNLFTYKALKKINMIESLKSVE